MLQQQRMSSVGKSLTMEMVFNKTKSDNLNNIKNLNLWGNELEDLSLVQKMPNLQVISLSVNKISSLKYFSKCFKLNELYLRKNCIQDIKQIRHLLNLPYLKSLWLYDNPCSQIENYRQIIIHHLPNLSKLDNNAVTPQEKSMASSSRFQLDFKNSEAQIPAEKQKNNSRHQQKRYQQKKPKRHEPEQQKVQPVWKQPSKQQSSKIHNYESSQQTLNRNKNILIAVLSLMKQLDVGSLEIIRKQAQKSIKNR